MEKEILTQINRTVLAVLLRALRVLYREDSRIRTEIDSWPEGLTSRMVSTLRLPPHRRRTTLSPGAMAPVVPP